VRRAAVAQLAVILAAVLVAWSASPWATSDLVVVSLVLLALAVAASTAGGVAALAPSHAVAPRLRGPRTAPLRRSRPTDPTRHPLAPRAPGLV